MLPLTEWDRLAFFASGEVAVAAGSGSAELLGAVKRLPVERLSRLGGGFGAARYDPDSGSCLVSLGVGG